MTDDSVRSGALLQLEVVVVDGLSNDKIPTINPACQLSIETLQTLSMPNNDNERDWFNFYLSKSVVHCYKRQKKKVIKGMPMYTYYVLATNITYTFITNFGLQHRLRTLMGFGHSFHPILCNGCIMWRVNEAGRTHFANSSKVPTLQELHDGGYMEATMVGQWSSDDINKWHSDNFISNNDVD